MYWLIDAHLFHSMCHEHLSLWKDSCNQVSYPEVSWCHRKQRWRRILSHQRLAIWALSCRIAGPSINLIVYCQKFQIMCMLRIVTKCNIHNINKVGEIKRFFMRDVLARQGQQDERNIHTWQVACTLYINGVCCQDLHSGYYCITCYAVVIWPVSVGSYGKSAALS